MNHRNRERTKGAQFLFEADRMRRRTAWLRAAGALASVFGAVAQSAFSPVVGGVFLAGGLMLLAIGEEVRRSAITMSQEARRAARRQIAEEAATTDLVDYLGEIASARRARAA